MKPPPFQYEEPREVDEALRLLAEHGEDGKVLAGGQSLVPLLKEPNAKWDRPSITTHGRNNHALRTEKWRYIRYADGSEELYDHDSDPLEWKNLATDPATAKVRAELAAQLPKTNVPDAPREKEKDNKKKKKKKE